MTRTLVVATVGILLLAALAIPRPSAPALAVPPAPEIAMAPSDRDAAAMPQRVEGGFVSKTLQVATPGGAIRVEAGKVALTLTLKQAGTLYDGAPADFSPLGADGLSAPRGAMVERLIPVRGGVEQLFDIADRVDSDVTFRIGVDGDLRGPEEGWEGNTATFWTREGLAVTYGNVVAVDAGGDRLPRRMTWSGGEIAFTIPGTWLATATYPVVVDPLIGDLIEFAGETEDFRTGNDNDVAFVPNAIPALEKYIAVYTVRMPDPGLLFPDGKISEIRGVFINADGGTLGQVMTLMSGANSYMEPSVSWNPASQCFLLTYRHKGNPGDAASWEIYGRFLGVNGLPIGESFQIGSNDAPGAFNPVDYRPRVRYNGSGWLVVWPMGSGTSGLTQAMVKGRIIRYSGGSPSFPGPWFSLYNAWYFMNPLAPDVAYDPVSGKCLVVWDDSAAPGSYDHGAVVGRTVDQNGGLGEIRTYSPPESYQPAGTPSHTTFGPRVAAGVGGYLVTWVREEIPTDGSIRIGHLQAAKVDTAGAIAGPVVSVLTDPGRSAYCPAPVAGSSINTYFIGYYEPAVAGTYADCAYRGAVLRGEDLSVVQDDILLGQPGTDLDYWGARMLMTTAVARQGTSEVYAQWRSVSIQWIDGEGSKIVPPAPVQARRYKLNRPPAEPVALQQSNSRLAEAFVAAGPGLSVTEQPRAMSFRVGPMTDPENDAVRLQIEYVTSGSAFTGIPNASGTLVPVGGAGTLTIDPMTESGRLRNGSYKWRARVQDSDGNASRWVAFDLSSMPDFTVSIRNRNAAAPIDLRQVEANGSTTIPAGGTTHTGRVILEGRLNFDPDWDLVRLEVEVRPMGENFTGVATHVEPAFHGHEGLRSLTFKPVVPGTSYHWRAWAADDSGDSGYDRTATTSPTPAGPDFTRDGDTDPSAPASLGQFQPDEVTAIPPGGDTDSKTVVFRGRVSDEDSDDCAMEVEVKPADIAFDGRGLVRGTMTESGGESLALAGNLKPGRAYHWRARSVETFGLASPAFTAFGTTGRDFVVPDTFFGGSAGTASCGNSAPGAAVLPWLILLVTAFARGGRR